MRIKDINYLHLKLKEFGANIFPPYRKQPLDEEWRAVVVSFWMANLPQNVIKAQREALQRFIPKDVKIEQILTNKSHSIAIDDFLKKRKFRNIIILDIDCIPVSEEAINRLLESLEKGNLVGAVQRADHLENNNHLYAGPFCMGFSRETWEKMGKPSFKATNRGDVGEELTYAAENQNIEIDLMWPSACEKPLWNLTDDTKFGVGTTYESLFWHSFQIRMPEHHRYFVGRVKEILEEAV